MTDLRTAAQQALEALEWLTSAEPGDEPPINAAITALRAALAQPSISQQVVDEQAEDEGLWFRAETAAEAYLQQELRRLHAAVEGER